MALTVKKKIWLGTLFLFFLLILTGGTGIYYMAKLKKEASNVLHDNYKSLVYCHNMQQSLNNIEAGLSISKDSFEINLKNQEANVTEPGEQNATSSLRASFNKIKSGDTVQQNFRIAEMQLQQILELNMQAIQAKNNTAEKTADEAFTIISLLAGFVSLIALSFLFNFPAIIIQSYPAINRSNKRNIK